MYKRQLPGASDPRFPEFLVRLRDGSALAGILQTSSDAKTPATVKKFGGDVVNIPGGSLVSVQFSPLSKDDLEKITAATAGALTADGDFLAGEVKTVKNDKITISSVNFGLTTMERREISFLVYQAMPPREPHLIDIRLQDGSLVVAKNISVDKEQVVIDEPLMGNITVPFRDVLSLDRKP